MSQFTFNPDFISSYIIGGRVDAVRDLLDTGAVDVNLYVDSMPLLTRAVLTGHIDVVKVLLEHGARADAICDYKWTALHCACMGNLIEIVRILIAAGCDINARRCGGFTPLVTAVECDKADVARMLIDAGADVTILPRISVYCDRYSLARNSDDIAQLVAESRPRHVATLLNWLLAMAPLQLPIYIFLELADRAVVCPTLKEIEKIKIIQGVMDSYRGIKRVRVVPRRSARLAKRYKH